MQKERLTVENIKSDLWNQTKDSFLGFVFLSLFFAALLIIVFLVPFTIYKVLFGILAAISLYYVAKLAVMLISFYRSFRNTDCIIKDKLVGMEIKSHVDRTRYYETFHLYFSGYGEYMIPDENYKWSSMFRMSCNGVYNYASCGDEFYLVISKKHTGKILLAYNSKLFELEE